MARKPDVKTEAAELPVEVVQLSELRPHPRNYQTHPEDQIAQLRASLRKHGWWRPIVVAEDLTILAGHGIAQAAAAEGRTTAPIVRLPYHPDHPRALEVMTGDNELNNMAEVDDRLLSELLREVLHSAEGELEGTGFDEEQLAALVMTTRSSAELADFDAAAEWVGLPDFTPGEKAVTLVIQFESPEDRVRFLEEHGWEPHYRRTAQAWSMLWPQRPRTDLASIMFEDEARAEP